ncbi:MAG: hypothetical protein ACJA19_001239, partial [Bacteroidia bacterium]
MTFPNSKKLTFALIKESEHMIIGVPTEI